MNTENAADRRSSANDCSTDRELIEDYCIRAGRVYPWAAEAGREIKALKRRLGELEEPEDEDDTPRPCLLCGRELAPAVNNWKTMQPMDGGEVRFVFSFGSTRFDEGPGTTEFRAVICDECGAKHVDQMERVCP